MTTPYCSACLDTWSIQQTRIARGDWTTVTLGISLHVSCGRVLEALRTAPPVDVSEAAA